MKRAIINAIVSSITIGVHLASAGVTINTWQFWAVMVGMGFLIIFNYLEGRKDEN